MPPDSFDAAGFRRKLLGWFRLHKRDLPWRRTDDPYRIWISEIMLQQTRVAAVVNYYQRFLQRFPTVQALAAAPEQDLLAAWAGLGYYSRARNAQKAARLIVERGGFPRDYESIRALPGVGEYTAAAVASIAFGLRHAAVDGNVIRVLSRVAAETDRRQVTAFADALVSPRRPGDFNQALMELGATVCVPRDPRCLLCPVAAHCRARQAGRQDEFPLKRKKPENLDERQLLLYIERAGEVLLWQRPDGERRLAGFWELPRAAQLPQAEVQGLLGEFRHTIVNTRYRFEVAEASLSKGEFGFSWVAKGKLDEIPLSTASKKALACINE